MCHLILSFLVLLIFYFMFTLAYTLVTKINTYIPWHHLAHRAKMSTMLLDFTSHYALFFIDLAYRIWTFTKIYQGC